jgi:hypothetical protein
MLLLLPRKLGSNKAILYQIDSMGAMHDITSHQGKEFLLAVLSFEGASVRCGASFQLPAAKNGHCERSEAISAREGRDCFVVSLLAMTEKGKFPASPNGYEARRLRVARMNFRS